MSITDFLKRAKGLNPTSFLNDVDWLAKKVDDTIRTLRLQVHGPSTTVRDIMGSVRERDAQVVETIIEDYLRSYTPIPQDMRAGATQVATGLNKSVLPRQVEEWQWHYAQLRIADLMITRMGHSNIHAHDSMVLGLAANPTLDEVAQAQFRQNLRTTHARPFLDLLQSTWQAVYEAYQFKVPENPALIAKLCAQAAATRRGWHRLDPADLDAMLRVDGVVQEGEHMGVDAFRYLVGDNWPTARDVNSQAPEYLMLLDSTSSYNMIVSNEEGIRNMRRRYGPAGIITTNRDIGPYKGLVVANGTRDMFRDTDNYKRVAAPPGMLGTRLSEPSDIAALVRFIQPQLPITEQSTPAVATTPTPQRDLRIHGILADMLLERILIVGTQEVIEEIGLEYIGNINFCGYPAIGSYDTLLLHARERTNIEQRWGVTDDNYHVTPRGWLNDDLLNPTRSHTEVAGMINDMFSQQGLEQPGREQRTSIDADNIGGALDDVLAGRTPTTQPEPRTDVAAVYFLGPRPMERNILILSPSGDAIEEVDRGIRPQLGTIEEFGLQYSYSGIRNVERWARDNNIPDEQLYSLQGDEISLLERTNSAGRAPGSPRRQLLLEIIEREFSDFIPASATGRRRQRSPISPAGLASLEAAERRRGITPPTAVDVENSIATERLAMLYYESSEPEQRNVLLVGRNSGRTYATGRNIARGYGQLPETGLQWAHGISADPLEWAEQMRIPTERIYQLTDEEKPLLQNNAMGEDMEGTQPRFHLIGLIGAMFPDLMPRENNDNNEVPQEQYLTPPKGEAWEAWLDRYDWNHGKVKTGNLREQKIRDFVSHPNGMRGIRQYTANADKLDAMSQMIPILDDIENNHGRLLRNIFARHYAATQIVKGVYEDQIAAVGLAMVVPETSETVMYGLLLSGAWNFALDVRLSVVEHGVPPLYAGRSNEGIASKDTEENYLVHKGVNTTRIDRIARECLESALETYNGEDVELHQLRSFVDACKVFELEIPGPLRTQCNEYQQQFMRPPHNSPEHAIEWWLLAGENWPAPSFWLPNKAKYDALTKRLENFGYRIHINDETQTLCTIQRIEE